MRHILSILFNPYHYPFHHMGSRLFALGWALVGGSIMAVLTYLSEQ